MMQAMPSGKRRRGRSSRPASASNGSALSEELRAFDRSVMRKIALAIVAAKVLLVPVVFDPSGYVIFAHPKALAAHALGFALGGVLIALALRYGRSVLPHSPLHFAVAGVVAASSLATLFALDQQIALFGTLDRQLGLVTLVDNVILYFAIVVLVRSRADLLLLAALSAIATVCLLAYATMQRLDLDPLTWRSSISTHRPFAMLGNPGNLAQYFGTVAAATTAGLIACWSRMTPVWRSVVGAWALLATAGAILTGARAVGLGLSVAAVLVGVHAITDWVPRRWRAYAGAGAAAVLVLGLGIGAREIVGTGLDLVTGRVTTTEGSITGRIDIYRVALSQVADRPLLGVGPDNYVVAYPRYRLPDTTRFHESDAPQTSPHSWPLKAATDSGALGLGTYAVLFGVASWLAVRRSGLAMVGLAAVASFLGTGTISISDVGTEWMLWAGLALIALPARIGQAMESPVETGRRGRASPRRVGAGKAGLAWLAITVGLVLALFQYNAFEASRAAASSRQARQSASPALAVAIATGQRAVALDPNIPEYWHDLGLALAANERLRPAEDAFRRAADAAPYQAVYWINLAKAQIAIGQGSGGPELAEALATARRAAAADPNLADVHQVLALALLANGSPAAAAEAAELSLTLNPYPRDRTLFEVAARAYLEDGRPGDVERWAKLGIPQTAGRDQIDLRVLLARALVQQGRTQEGREQLRIVLESVPDHPEALRLQRELDGQ